MKKIFLAVLMAVASVAAVADDYQYLTVKTSSEETSITLATIQKITFDMDAKTILVTTSEGVVTFPQSEMQKMFFSASATAIEQLPETSEGLVVKRGNLEVKGSGLVYIYGSNGTLLQVANVENATSISLSNLPKGIYIVNMGKQTIKIRK